MATTASGGRPPRPPRRGEPSGGGRPPFDPDPDDLVGRYLPARRALRCGELPPQIHDADVYGAHPAFLAKVHPPAGADGLQWLFFVCRGRGLGGKRRAGRGAYRLVGEATPRGGACCYCCHSFRYHEDSPAGSAARETEWRMDEYGENDDPGGSGAAGAFDMVVCKVYPARGGALRRSLHLDSAAKRAAGAEDDMKPQVLVQLYLASLRAGDPLRCRMHPATDVCADHPAVLTGVLPPANDQYEWFFSVRRPRTEEHADDGVARPRRAGPGKYVPAARYWGVRDGEGREVGYRRVFRYREDDEETLRVSKTEWWMEEYGFGPGFPYGEEHGNDDYELVVYKVYLRMARPRR
ncbi:hypothetical protein BS78_06G154400 [Paspalum vaginatum]|nr:hypothetical protein BS78_06G154400 [Paspalum vaginatum]